MSSNIIIDWQETNPVWEKFAVSPLLDELHIIRIGIANNLEKILRHTGLLSGEELIKSERFVREQDKYSFLASSVMKKILCSYYIGCEPQSVEFEVNEFNKPKIKIQKDIHYNTSHSGDWLLFIFSNNPCGIDVERINPEFDYISILEMSFHHDEIDFIQKSKEPINQFFKIWTIKESILKAEGTGLMDNLNELNTLQDFAKLPENTDPWNTKSLLIEEDYWCSLCFKNASSKIKYFEF
ncbi:4'-phosphopantetheinyl transferase family protein [Aquiflexum gelatinilyticum]|uniref:4'-phosphopantetheinyl transferase superfamily protein n=1 Tax=Aquiflexum gelatinilyticum TaxID=2961943 RepID=A0A9X2T329_9BACT|nr:4'-phosphopantetheinyl transferase superfamily protein [Aquiflexum gelatinilyticum]MCR9016010.1 4'-phosphopantetheinyl transferase superfamily protein [Aquiflexum gelatinilyticum]